ncbi:MAG: hypothetical protein AB9856_00975 [Cellulosilyticaceae bacterium]
MNSQLNLFNQQLAKRGKDININNVQYKGIIKLIKDTKTGFNQIEIILPLDVPISYFDTLQAENNTYLAINIEKLSCFIRILAQQSYHKINVKFKNTELMQFNVIPCDSNAIKVQGDLFAYVDTNVQLLLQRTEKANLISNSTRFFLYDGVYKCYHKTYENDGILKLYCELDNFNEKDDKVNKIAYNGDAALPKPKYKINVIVGGNGTVTPNGALEVIEGDSMTFNVVPNQGYIAKVKVNGVDIPLTNNSFTLRDIKQDYIINVTFEFKQVDNYTIKIEGLKEVNCGKSYKYMAKVYNAGIEVGNKLVNWTVDDADNLLKSYTPNSNEITLVTNNKDNTGEFVLKATLQDDNAISNKIEIYVGW